MQDSPEAPFDFHYQVRHLLMQMLFKDNNTWHLVFMIAIFSPTQACADMAWEGDIFSPYWLHFANIEMMMTMMM